MIEIIPKLTIRTELYSSKNSMQFVRTKNGRTVLLKSKRAREQDSVLYDKLVALKPIWKLIGGENKTKPLKVGFYIYRKTKRRWDWTNIIQGLSDAMVRAGYLKDDSAEYFTPVFLGFSVDPEDPRVEITIE